jgi:hypothetical protein
MCSGHLQEKVSILNGEFSAFLARAGPSQAFGAESCPNTSSCWPPSETPPAALFTWNDHFWYAWTSGWCLVVSLTSESDAIDWPSQAVFGAILITTTRKQIKSSKACITKPNLDKCNQTWVRNNQECSICWKLLATVPKGSRKSIGMKWRSATSRPNKFAATTRGEATLAAIFSRDRV